MIGLFWMKISRQLSVSEQFIFGKALERISDLNKVIFSYRLVYVSLIAGYFTSLSFVSGISSNSAFLTFPNAYALLLTVLSLATFVGITVLLYFDFIHQELLENSVQSAAQIEKSSRHFEGRRIFYRPSAKVTSLYISLAIFLFYSVPSSVLFGFIVYLTSQVHTSKPYAALEPYKDRLCDYTDVFDETTQQIVERVFDPACLDVMTNFSFTSSFRDTIFFCFVVAAFFGGLTLIVSFHRIFGRLMLCFSRSDYSSKAVHPGSSTNLRRSKRVFDVTMNILLLAFTFIGLAGICLYAVLPELFDPLQSKLFPEAGYSGLLLPKF